MSDAIGDAAGKIWHYLNSNGEASVNKLSTETGLSKNDVHRGIGWLAKEDKIDIDNNGRIEMFSLK